MNELDKIEVVDDREPERVLQLQSYIQSLRRLQAAAVCLKDAMSEEHISDTFRMKIRLAEGDVHKCIDLAHARIMTLDPDVATFEDRQRKLEHERKLKQQYKERKQNESNNTE